MVRIFLTNGLAVMVVSAFFFGLSDVVVKFVSPMVAATGIAFFRFLVGAAILVPLMVPRGISLKGDRPWILVLRGFSGTLTFLFLIKSITLIPLASAMVLFYTFPVFSAFFSFLVFREPLGGWELILIVVGLIGIYVLIDPGSSLSNGGDIYGLLAGCCAGFTVVLIRKLRETNGPLIIYFYYCLVGGGVCLPLFVREFRMPSFPQLLLLIALGLTFLIAQLLMNQGFKFCKASEGSVILTLEAVFAGIAGVVIFKDALPPGLLAGAFLIMVSGVGLNLINRRSRRSGSVVSEER